VQGPADVHGAAAVVDHDHIGAGGADAGDLVADHRAGEFAVFDRERAPEAAALVHLLHGTVLDAANPGEQPDGLVGHADAAKVATVVIRGDGREVQVPLRPVHLEHLLQVLDELERPGGQGLGPLVHGRVVLEGPGEVLADDRAARAGGRDHHRGVLEDVDHATGHAAELVGKAAVEGGLATAGLVLGEIDLEAQAAQDAHHAGGHVRIKQVGQAGDEK
jgi:hypothetical protein